MARNFLPDLRNVLVLSANIVIEDLTDPVYTWVMLQLCLMQLRERAPCTPCTKAVNVVIAERLVWTEMSRPPKTRVRGWEDWLRAPLGA